MNKSVEITGKIGPIPELVDTPWRAMMVRTNGRIPYELHGDGKTVFVDDMFSDAPNGVLEAIVLNVFLKTDKEERIIDDYMCGTEIARNHRMPFMDGQGIFTGTERGNVRDLGESKRRLMDMGLVTEEDLEYSRFTWYKSDPNGERMLLGCCYQPFRLIAIHPLFDSRDVSRRLLDFVMYHEILHLRQNRIRNSIGHDELFYRWEHEFPYWWQVHYEYSRLTGSNLLSDKDVVLCRG